MLNPATLPPRCLTDINRFLLTWRTQNKVIVAYIFVPKILPGKTNTASLESPFCDFFLHTGRNVQRNLFFSTAKASPLFLLPFLICILKLRVNALGTFLGPRRRRKRKKTAAGATHYAQNHR